MTVKELKNIIKDLPDDTEIIYSESDEIYMAIRGAYLENGFVKDVVIIY